MVKPIRVLQCFGRMDLGGAETLMMNIYRNIDREKIQFDFVVHTRERCAYDDEIHLLGGRIFNVPRYNGMNHFEYKNAWKELFRNNNGEWQIIHGHMFVTSGIYLNIANRFGLITIAHSHSTSSGNGFQGKIKDIFQYPIKYTARYLFACSKEAGMWLYGKKACENDNFFILNNSLDAKKFVFDSNIRLQKRKELLVADKFVIGHIGRFEPSKNHDFLIEIFYEIHTINNKATLLLIGDGALRHFIEDKVKKFGLDDSVIFMGTRSDIPELLQAMDVFLFPSLYEGLGVVAIEAQATGLRTIVSEAIPNEAYLTDLIEREYLSSSSSQWANRILKYVDGYDRRDTSDIIKSMGYDIKETTKWLQEFYINVIK